MKQYSAGSDLPDDLPLFIFRYEGRHGSGSFDIGYEMPERILLLYLTRKIPF